MPQQIINIRGIQYHQAQLADRLRVATGAGVNWESMRKVRARSGKAGGTWMPLRALIMAIHRVSQRQLPLLLVGAGHPMEA